VRQESHTAGRESKPDAHVEQQVLVGGCAEAATASPACPVFGLTEWVAVTAVLGTFAFLKLTVGVIRVAVDQVQGGPLPEAEAISLQSARSYSTGH
jgi:hypothetical protein